MKQSLLFPLFCLGAATQVYAAESACSFVSAADIQAAFGQTVEISTDTPEICDYEKDGFSVRVMHIDYHDEIAAKKGFKTLFSGKNKLEGLGDEANSHRQGREIDKVSMRQGQEVISVSKLGGEYVDDGLQKLEGLLRLAASKLANSGTATSSATAVDPACETVIKASEAKLAQAAWHTITEADGLKLEAIKLNDQFFMNTEGAWQPAPDLSHAERVAIGMMKDGTIKMTACKEEGSDTLAGVEVVIFSYHSDMAGMGAGTNQLYIGKADGLPYKSLTKTEKGETSTQTVRYQDIIAPKL